MSNETDEAWRRRIRGEFISDVMLDRIHESAERYRQQQPQMLSVGDYRSYTGSDTVYTVTSTPELPPEDKPKPQELTMERKEEISKQIANFLKATRLERRNLLTFGVELEFQRDEGCNCIENLGDEDRYDMDSLQKHRDEVAQKALDCMELEEIFRWFRFQDIPHKVFVEIYGLHPTGGLAWLRKSVRTWTSTQKNYMRQVMGKYLEAHFAESGCESIEEYLRDVMEADMEEILDELRDDVYIDWEEYEHDHDELREMYCGCSEFDVPECCELVEDQSVSGGEVHTVGGMSADQVLAVADNVLKQAPNCDRYVDTDCSAHLHVKLGDISHYYGRGNLHRCIMEYISMNLAKLPQPVRKRLVGGGNRWIEPKLSHDKYRWVHFHDQGTIEFRLFGNIDNIEDLEACLQFAVDALAYAYRVRKLRRRTNPAKFLHIIKLNEEYNKRNFGPAVKNVQAMSNDEITELCCKIAA